MNTCPNCSKIVKNRKFCNNSCSATYYNLRRSAELNKKRIESIKRTVSLKKTIKNQFGIHPRITKMDIIGPYCKVYLCKCKYSGQPWFSKTVKTIHPDLASTKKQYTYSCQFRFGISSYPNWFSDASMLIQQYGWYSTPGSRKGITNTNGISRDHLYSITDGWLNQIPPPIIRHPANCSLIPHKQNQSKHKKSKITLQELYERIESFDAIYGLPVGYRAPSSSFGD